MSSPNDSASSSPRVNSPTFTPSPQENGTCRDTATPETTFSQTESSSPAERNHETDDVAIIGFSCRVPGGNNSPSQLWSFLLKKGDASGDIPSMRWEPYNKRQAGNAEILARTTSKGYFIDRLEDFDATFFGISPREAEQIDPQQRITCETVWEALEHSGIPPQSLSGSDTAVFMGVNSDDYSRLLLEDLPKVEAWMGVGTAFCGIPNRISYLLDLLGPSSAIDAACASSLVAVHHGRQALLAKETSLVIAGGVNALIGPGLTRVLDNAGAISSDGRCCSFDDAAKGYGRGEGAGIVIMKRLADAVRDGDRILAVLKGSAVGADGRTNGIMAPNQLAQERVATQALKAAGTSASTISYVEAHATSTPVGDLTECAAMANVYGSGARKAGSAPCYIGSIKSNIGHLEAGAGVMGLIKAIMVLQNGLIPPQANLTVPNTKFDWDSSLLKPVTEATSLPKTQLPQRAAISSYGYGGTVAHAIIETAPSQSPSIRSVLSRSPGEEPAILLLSAPSSLRIKVAASELAHFLGASQELRNNQVDLHSVAYSLAVKRGHHKFRTAILADSPIEAVKLLNEVAQNRQNSQIFNGRADAIGQGKGNGSVWVFSGHGAQWKHMGLALLDEEPAFAEIVQLLEPIIEQEMGFSAATALRSGSFESTDKIQILTYVMQVGLAAVLKTRGLQPKAIIGHSHGEIAASVVAGALTLTEGAMICAVRARLYRSVAGTGAMILVNMPYDTAMREIHDRTDVAVAIDSSPSSCVLSGTREAIEELSTEWTQKGVQVRTVQSDTAFHSPMLLALVEPLREALRGILCPKEPTIPLYSTSASDPRTAGLRDVGYWTNNMINVVNLTSTINAAVQDGFKVFLEVSSHPIVSHSISEILLDADIVDGTVIPTLLRNKDAQRSLLLSLGKLHCVGDSADFKTFLLGKWLPNVPGTRWEHQPYWRQVTDPSTGRSVNHDVHAHVLLGGRTAVHGTNTVLWQTHLDSDTKPFPGKHPLHGVEIVPAAVLLNTFLSAAPGHTLRNVSLHSPVVIGKPREVQILLDGNEVRISSRLIETEAGVTQETSWVQNTTTQIALPAYDLAQHEKIDIAAIKKRVTTRLSESFSIDYLAEVGVSEMGFPWKVLEHFRDENEMLAKVHADPEASTSKHWGGSSWASILDAATSVSSTIFFKDPLLRMPTAIEQVEMLQNVLTPKICYIYVVRAIAECAANVFVLSEEGRVFCKIDSLKFAGIEGNPLTRKSDKDLIYKMAWPPAKLAETPLRFQEVVCISNKTSPLLMSYQARLETLRVPCTILSQPEDVLSTSEDSVIVFIPDGARTENEIYEFSARSCDRFLTIIKILSKTSSRRKAFCITQGVSKGTNAHALSQAALLGLARIIRSEQSAVFGGLIDVEDDQFPMQAIKYVQDVDVIRIEDTVARNARLQAFTADTVTSQIPFRLQPHGTYVITGGLGALGLEVADYLAEKGAKRIVLVSRRTLPPRRQWEALKDQPEIQRILDLEAIGLSVYPVSVDMTAFDASTRLLAVLDRLSLPRVLGVVHAAGTLANQMVTQTTPEAFDFVTAPKILGALALHEAFPPKTLDFMVLFSSCGQLLGFTGQASYASGNSFLDTLATHRRNAGDNTVSMLWTSWRGLGMAVSSRYIEAELRARGITDVTRDDAFMAWEKIFKYNTEHAVVLRTLPVEFDDPSPHPILDDILVRNRTTTSLPNGGVTQPEPTSGPELQASLVERVTQCVALTLSLSKDAVDPHAALSELGMDSVMMVEFRTHLQQALKVKVGPTLLWNCPTVMHLVAHFVKEKTK